MNFCLCPLLSKYWDHRHALSGPVLWGAGTQTQGFLHLTLYQWDPNPSTSFLTLHFVKNRRGVSGRALAWYPVLGPSLYSQHLGSDGRCVYLVDDIIVSYRINIKMQKNNRYEISNYRPSWYKILFLF